MDETCSSSWAETSPKTSGSAGGTWARQEPPKVVEAISGDR